MAKTTTGEIKRWGRVAARPSEYLIKLHRGKIIRHGPGLSTFVWPGGSYVVLPTTIQRISFVADQITAERVGVEITGIAVYRIADPLIAYQMLDFSGGCQHGIGQLAGILRDMFVGAARRQVANMTVEQCISRRKEDIATELMREIAPVVSGSGRPEDCTDCGWGVVIDTIEIQDVRILSERVFADLQAPYRSELQLRSRQSQIECERKGHLQQVDADRATLTADQALQQQHSEAEEQSQLRAVARNQRVCLAEAEANRHTGDAEHELTHHQAEQEAALADYQADAQLQRRQRQVEAEQQIASGQAEIDRIKGELRLALARQQQQVDNLVSEERLRFEMITRTLPALAAAMAKNTGQVQLTQIATNGADGGGYLASTLAQLLAVAKAAGLDLSRLGTERSSDDKSDDRGGVC